MKMKNNSLRVIKLMIMFLLVLTTLLGSRCYGVEVDIPVKVDMSILWGSDLPEEVYLFAYNADFSDVNGLENEAGTTMSGYDENKKGTIDEQDTTKALKLTDPDGDAFYEGTMHYDGGATAFHTRLYIRKDDPNNLINMPKYEEHTGSDNQVIGDKQNFRTVTIESNGEVKIGWDGDKKKIINSDGTGLWKTAWENKDVQSFNFAAIDQGDITVYENFTRDIQVLAKYNNANENLRQDVTRYVNWISEDESIFEIYSKGTIKGISEGNRNLKIERDGIIANKNIIVIKMSDMTKRQYLISGMDIEKGYYGIKGIANYPGGVGGNLITNGDLVKDIYDNVIGGTNYKPFNRPILDGEFVKWTYGNTETKNAIYISRELTGNTEMKDVEIKNYQNGNIKETKIPVTIKDIEVKKEAMGVSFDWNESLYSDYKKEYNAGQDIFFRVAKIDSTEAEVSYFAMNPLKKIEDHLDEYKDGTIKYIDFFFDYTRSSVVGAGGITASYNYGHLNIDGLPLGEYRLQVYTMKVNRDYAVFTFDTEVPFQTPQEMIGGLQLKDNYIMHSIRTDYFSEIKVNFLTRTKEDISLTRDDIKYKGEGNKLAEEHYSELSTTETKLDGGFSLNEDTDFSLIKYPLDIILCVDTSSSMAGDLQNLKSSWGAFEAEIKAKTAYDTKFRLITFGYSNSPKVWKAGNVWRDSLNDGGTNELNDMEIGTSNSSQEPSAAAIRKATEIMRDSGRSMDSSWNIIDNNTGAIKSQKIIIFVSDANTKATDPTPDELAQLIRDQNIYLTGIGGVKKDGLMLEDDLGAEGGYPSDNDAKNEEHYYHLKLILGDRFQFYQMGTDSIAYLTQLKETLKRMPVIKKWTITYLSPYSLPDGIERKVKFDVKDLEYMGKEGDRKYRAPYRETTNAPADQTVILKLDETTAEELKIADYKYQLADTISYQNTFRKMKTINITEEGITADIKNNPLTYTDKGTFSLIESINDRRWKYNGPITNDTNGIMLKKVPTLGNSELKRYTEEGEKKLLKFGYTEALELEKPVENGDSVTIGWKNAASNSGVTLSNEKIMFRLMKQDKIGTSTVSSIKFNIYEKENPINELKEGTITTTTGDSISIVDQKMQEFYKNTADYVDVIFDKSENKSLYAGGAKFLYVSGNLVIRGLNMDKYAIEAYTFKDGEYTTTSSAINYKVVTYCGVEKFKIGAPSITGLKMTSNGLFKITEIDQTSFSAINVEIATMMPHKIRTITKENLFENTSLITSSGIITRLSETNITEGSTKKNILTDEIEIGASEFSKDFQYPLDIVFCIDNSFSMDEEIKSIKNGLNTFTEKLTNNGFDVKFNLITFGPKQNTNYSGYGQPTGDFPINEYVDDGYGAIYKEKWFTNLDELKTAFGKIIAIDGFIWYQENGLTAINHAIKKLTDNGRTLSADGTILDNPTGVLKSKKWIIFLTDENADEEYLPDGTSDEEDNPNYIIEDLSKKMADEDITLTGIYHVDKEGIDPSFVSEYNGKPEEYKLSIKDYYIYDDSGNRGVLPSDTGGIYYYNFRFYMGKQFHIYEMGSTGENVGTALDKSTNDIGIVQYWNLKYNTPFPENDGSTRQINFVLGNLEAESSDINIKLSPDDVNKEEDRRYNSPSLNLEIEFTTPTNNGWFESGTDESKYKIKGKIRAVKDEGGIINIKPERVKISIMNNGDNSQKVKIPEIDSVDEILIEEDESDDNNNWYIFEIEIDKSIIKNSGYDVFDVMATGYLESGESSEEKVTEIKYDNTPPVINTFEIRNLDLEKFWKDWGVTDSHYWVFKQQEGDKGYVKNGDHLQINMDITEEFLTKVELSGLITKTEITTNTGISFGTSNIETNDIVVNNNGNETVTLTLKVTDKGGNEAIKTIEVQVDNIEPLLFEIDGNEEEYTNSGEYKILLKGLEDNTDGSGIRDVVFSGTYEWDGFSDLLAGTSGTAIHFSDHGVTDKKATMTAGGNDGRYQFEKKDDPDRGIISVDKAGNIKKLDKTLNRYIDTVSPRVSDLEIKKIIDGNGIEGLQGMLGADGAVKKGDVITVTTTVSEWATNSMVSSYSGLVSTSKPKFNLTPGGINITPQSIIIGDENGGDESSIEITSSEKPTPPSKVVSFVVTDKAGNTTTVSKNLDLDNTPPTMDTVEAKPTEILDGWNVISIDSEMDTYNENGNDVWYTRFNKSDVECSATDASGIFGYKSGTLISNSSPIRISGLTENQLNTIEVIAIDNAGNISTPMSDDIVVDTEINGAFGSMSKVVSRNDTVIVNFSQIEELSGLYKYQGKITSTAFGTDDIVSGEIKFSDIELANHYKVKTAGGYKNISMDLSGLPLDKYVGSRFRIMVDVWDQLGNKATLNAGEYVLKKSMTIKSMEKGGRRQVETEVDLGGTGGNINLEIKSRKEGGR